MEFRSSDVMAYILKKAKDSSHPLNKTQAQKILYCCYGAVMGKFNERLTDEHPKAWMYGPVFPRTINDINKKRLNVSMAENFEKSCPESWLELINKTIVAFWDYSASQLSNWSHAKNSPWSKADPLSSLDDREIGLFFQKLLPTIEEKGSTCITTFK